MNILLTINRESQIYIENVREVIQLHTNHPVSLHFRDKLHCEEAEKALSSNSDLIIKRGLIENPRYYTLFVKGRYYGASIHVIRNVRPENISKESWSRKEVEALCRKAFTEGWDVGYAKIKSPEDYIYHEDKFIKEHIK